MANEQVQKVAEPAPVEGTPAQAVSWKMTTMKWVMWSVRNHWLWMVVIVGLQWLTGHVLNGDLVFVAGIFSFATWRQIHLVNSWVIVGTVGVMAAEKLFLWMSRSGRI